MDLVVAFGQLCLATVLVWSGVLKARDVSAFRRHIDATIPWLNRRMSAAVAVAVPAVEMSAAALLLAGPSAWVGCALATVLLAAFTGYLVSRLRSPTSEPCGCTGSDDIPVSGVHLVRNVLLLGLCGLTWWATVRTGGPGFAVYAVTAAPAAVVGVVVLHLGELVSLFRPTRMTRELESL